MTKQEFLSGKSFSLDGDYSSTTTYKYRGSGTELGALEREYRMYNDIDTYYLINVLYNVHKILNISFFLYILLFKTFLLKIFHN